MPGRKRMEPSVSVFELAAGETAYRANIAFGPVVDIALVNISAYRVHVLDGWLRGSGRGWRIFFRPVGRGSPGALSLISDGDGRSPDAAG